MGVLPVTMREAAQLSTPCWFEALQVYSPLSDLTGFKSSKAELVVLLRILYFSLCLISVPDLYHLKVTSGASVISHSNLALLPTLISSGVILSLNTGGTEATQRDESIKVSIQLKHMFVRDTGTRMVDNNDRRFSGVTVKEKNNDKNSSPMIS